MSGAGAAERTDDDATAVVRPLRPTLAEATRELTRGRVLDGADELLRERDWGRISMADIARAAGVSRQTVYNEFGSREGFAQEYILREVQRFVAMVEQSVLEHRDDPRAAVGAAFEVFLTAAVERPLIRAILAGDGTDGLLALFTTQGGPVITTATASLADVLQRVWPQAPSAEVVRLSDCVVRLAISHVALPGGSSEDAAASVARLLGPYVDEVMDPVR